MGFFLFGQELMGSRERTLAHFPRTKWPDQGAEPSGERSTTMQGANSTAANENTTARRVVYSLGRLFQRRRMSKGISGCRIGGQ